MFAFDYRCVKNIDIKFRCRCFRSLCNLSLKQNLLRMRDVFYTDISIFLFDIDDGLDILSPIGSLQLSIVQKLLDVQHFAIVICCLVFL